MDPFAVVEDPDQLRAPPRPMSTSIRVARASIEFSTSSFTTLAGRSMTSPAAILLTTLTESFWIRDPASAATGETSVAGRSGSVEAVIESDGGNARGRQR